MYMLFTSDSAPFPYGWEKSPWGMGDTAGASQIVAAGAAVATPVIGVVAASSAAASLAAGGTGLILGMAPALAVPVIGAAIAAVAIAVELLIKNSGCGVTCVETSSWANQAEPLLQQNMRAYFSLPAPRTQSQQTAALNIFDTVWARLQQQCTQPGTGNAGVRCISDRQAGACTWKQTANSPLLGYPGEPQPGACWNWFNGYRDPIANDSNVVPDATLASATSSAVSSVDSAVSSLTSDLTSGNNGLLIAGLALAAVAAWVAFS